MFSLFIFILKILRRHKFGVIIGIFIPIFSIILINLGFSYCDNLSLEKLNEPWFCIIYHDNFLTKPVILLLITIGSHILIFHRVITETIPFVPEQVTLSMILILFGVTGAFIEKIIHQIKKSKDV
jgi:hypothetical protein